MADVAKINKTIDGIKNLAQQKMMDKSLRQLKSLDVHPNMRGVFEGFSGPFCEVSTLQIQDDLVDGARTGVVTRVNIDPFGLKMTLKKSVGARARNNNIALGITMEMTCEIDTDVIINTLAKVSKKDVDMDYVEWCFIQLVADINDQRKSAGEKEGLVNCFVKGIFPLLIRSVCREGRFLTGEFITFLTNVNKVFENKALKDSLTDRKKVTFESDAERDSSLFEPYNGDEEVPLKNVKRDKGRKDKAEEKTGGNAKVVGDLISFEDVSLC